MVTCPKSPQQITFFIISHERSSLVEDWGFSLKTSTTPTFFEQFHSRLEDIHHTTENLLIIGDFNSHLDTTCSNSDSLIDSFDLTQKVNFPNHIHGYTLDLVFTKSNTDNISKPLMLFPTIFQLVSPQILD